MCWARYTDRIHTLHLALGICQGTAKNMDDTRPLTYCFEEKGIIVEIVLNEQNIPFTLTPRSLHHNIQSALMIQMLGGFLESI